MSDTPKNSDPSSLQPEETPVANETVVAQMLQMTVGKQYQPTQQQVDKFLSLQEKGMDYTHEERTKFLPSQLIDSGKFLVIAILVVGVFMFSAFWAKEYLGQIISGLFGLFAGGGIGYSLGIKKNKKG